MGMCLLWWMWMMRKGWSSSLGPFIMVFFCARIPGSSRASMTGCRLLWVPITWYSGEEAILTIAPCVLWHPVIISRPWRRLHGNTGLLNHQQPHPRLEYTGLLPCDLQWTWCLGQLPHLQLRGPQPLYWTTTARMRKMDPSISSTPAEFNWWVPERKGKHPHIMWCVIPPPRVIRLTPCGKLPGG